MDWASTQAGVRTISSEALEGVEALDEIQAPIEHAHSATLSDEYPTIVAELEHATPAAEVTESVPLIVAPPSHQEDQIPPPVVAISEPIGLPCLSQIEMVLTGAHTPQNFFAHDQPFNVHLTLDLSNIRIPDDTQFSYRASIYSKSLEGHSRQTVGETSGIFTTTDKVTAGIERIALPKSTYRLKAMVILNPMTTERTLQKGLVASKESDFLLIF